MVSLNASTALHWQSDDGRKIREEQSWILSRLLFDWALVAGIPSCIALQHRSTVAKESASRCCRITHAGQ